MLQSTAYYRTASAKSRVIKEESYVDNEQSHAVRHHRPEAEDFPVISPTSLDPKLYSQLMFLPPATYKKDTKMTSCKES